MRKSLVSKRKEMSDAQINDVTTLFGAFVEAEQATVLDAEGKEVNSSIVREGEAAPDAPDGGKVKRKPTFRIFRNRDFGFTTVTVERPLRDEQVEIVLGVKGKQKGKEQPDTALRDTENIPFSDDIGAYFA